MLCSYCTFLCTQIITCDLWWFKTVDKTSTRICNSESSLLMISVLIIYWHLLHINIGFFPVPLKLLKSTLFSRALSVSSRVPQSVNPFLNLVWKHSLCWVFPRLFHPQCLSSEHTKSIKHSAWLVWTDRFTGRNTDTGLLVMYMKTTCGQLYKVLKILFLPKKCVVAHISVMSASFQWVGNPLNSQIIVKLFWHLLM